MDFLTNITGEERHIDIAQSSSKALIILWNALASNQRGQSLPTKGGLG
jgi:hypothetical protein